ncbi:hypothetical protein APR11_006351 [Nocardia amikacinitolerans]|uniref:hypothetical protein n=1 Tax=Nocardia amikacinitolerans TaxID=756689 RepID=UPI0020A50BD2|nr:hypothetical protein [Nocardia amikacinitolerans]MCP2299892.1 hypothetical protein [Nocardia amikacinitolerans]
MFSIAALVPSPPILVPELGGAAAMGSGADPDDPPAVLRTAALDAAGALAAVTKRWTVLGVGSADDVLGPETAGTFRGFGVDLRVALADSATAPGFAADPRLPLPTLIAGWLRGRVAPAARATARLIAADTSAARCLELGAALRAELDADDEPRGVLVVADGAATLTVKSPGYLDERAVPLQAELDRALSAGDRAALRALDPALCAELAVSGRAAYQVLGGLFAADPSDPSVETHYRDAPFGVGYHVSVWRPEREVR